MANQLKIGNTAFSVGDLVRVHQKIKEGDRVRIQVFEGIVISIKGRGENKMFTVRKIAVGGVGVERIWPAISPWVEKVEVKKEGKVRRGKLYYLRGRVGKRAMKVKAKRSTSIKSTGKQEINDEKRPKNINEKTRTNRRETGRRTPQKK